MGLKEFLALNEGWRCLLLDGWWRELCREREKNKLVWVSIVVKVAVCVSKWIKWMKET